MAKVRTCTHCGSPLYWMASIDSDERVNFKWRHCDNAACGWDERAANFAADRTRAALQEAGR